MEYYTENWLKRAGDRIGKTIRVDDTTREPTCGKFARVCIEVDLTNPLKAGYKMRGRRWRLHYEGLHDLCFVCGQYGHREAACSKVNGKKQPTEAQAAIRGGSTSQTSFDGRDSSSSTVNPPPFGPWALVQRVGRRTMKTTKGKNGNLAMASNAE